jgi:predicted transposase/invertase (TIGR01784 family)
MLEIHILELPKLPKNDDDSELWAWLKFICTREETEMAELAKKNPEIGKATMVLKEMSEDEAEWYLAEAREKQLRDERGRALYREEQGMQRGLERGIQQGRDVAKIEDARKMKTFNIEIGIISEVTGLSIEEIEKL